MSALLLPDSHLMVGQGEQAHRSEKIAEDMAALGLLLPPAHLGAQQAREAAGHAGQR
jgi:hypothetical protein